jgi:hypothetical protein
MIDLHYKVVETLQHQDGQPLTTEQLAGKIGVSCEKAAEILSFLTKTGKICTKGNIHYIARESMWGWVAAFTLFLTAAVVLIMSY